MRGGTPVEGKEIVAWVAQPKQVAQEKVVGQLTVADVVNLISCNKALWERRAELLPPMLALARDGGLRVAQKTLLPRKYRLGVCASGAAKAQADTVRRAFVTFAERGLLRPLEAIADAVEVPRAVVLKAFLGVAATGNREIAEWLVDRFRITAAEVRAKDEIMLSNPFETASEFGHRDFGKWLVHEFRLTKADVQPHVSAIEDSSEADGDYSYPRWLKRRFPGLKIDAYEEEE